MQVRFLPGSLKQTQPNVVKLQKDTGCGASVARQVRDLEARGSIPRTPTKTISTQKYCVKLQAEKFLPALDKIPADRDKLCHSSE